MTLYGAMLVIGALASFGQTLPPRQQAADALDRRIAQLEALQLDHRITVLETVERDLRDSMFWSKIADGGVGLLLLEKALLLARKRNGNGNQ